MTRFILATMAASLLALPALAGEKPIGQPVDRNGMQISAVYLQSVMMDPASFGDVCLADRNSANPAGRTDAHIEADIKGLAGNPNGFHDGEWIPYLDIDYVLTKPGSTWKASGKLAAMVANDGPHYGANVAFDGPGKYHVAYTIKPPAGFYRHTDKETGVAAWWQPFTVEWDFAYAGSGKKGGY
jgi:uncharacterized protein involved in high-affinity Fe2+ transport